MKERMWLNKSTVKTRMFFAVTLSAQLLLGATPSYGQTSNRPTAVLERDINVSNVGTNRSQAIANKGADPDREYLIDIRNQAAQCAANTVVATNSVPAEIGNLEWTGQYAERFLRVPEGNSGKPKLVRFLIPVYREKSTRPEASVGTEDKQEQDRRVAEIGSTE
jgi:hypothetical protein